MAYKALYRTYRPQTFEEVVGQETIVKTLQNSILNNKIGHAYLFCGPRGTGKTSIARIFAKALNCPNVKDAKPCNNCAICNEITTGTSPDVIEIDAASNNGVDEIRELRDKVKFLPAGTKYKVYIIDEVHMLSTSAFNALLKTLEEPPAHAIFILATTEPNKVLPTIISRCQRYDFKSLTNDEIYKRLKLVCDKENIKFEEDALMSIAIGAEGGMRDGLSLLDQAISLADDVINDDVASSVTGTVDKTNLLTLARSIEDKNITDALKQITTLQNNGRDTQKITNGLLAFYRDILIYKANVNENNDPRYRDFADNVDLRKVYFYIDALNDVQSKIRFTNTPNIYLEVGLIKMISASSEELDYGKRILALEQQLENYSPQEGGSSVDSGDLKRLRLLEEKFNNLLSELSKLELFKVNDRLNALENNKNENNAQDEGSLKELNARVNKIVEDLELLKVMQESLRTQVDNAATGGIDDDVLADRIETNLKRIKPTVNYSEIESYVNKKVEELALNTGTYVNNNVINEESSNISNEELESVKENNIKLDEKINELNNKINHLNESIANRNEESLFVSNDSMVDMAKVEELERKVNDFINNQNNNEDNYDNGKLLELSSRIDELEEIVLSLEAKGTNPSERQNVLPDNIEDRIAKMESNIYKIMSGMLNAQPQKKAKPKVDEKQISLWSDDVDFGRNEKPAENIKADFEDFAKVTVTSEDVTDDDFVDEEKASFEEYSEHEETEAVEDVSNELDEHQEEEITESEPEEETNLFNGQDDEPVEEVKPLEDVDEDKPLFEESLEDFYSVDEEVQNEVLEENPTNNLFEEADRLEETEQVIEEENVEESKFDEEKRLEEERLEQERLAQEEKEKELKRLEEEKKAQEDRLYAEAMEREKALARQKAEEEREQKIIEAQKIEAARASGGADLDEYERYDVKVLERILNDARNPEYRDEKGRLDRVWNELLRLAPLDKRGVAEILSEGMVSAVGNHEFVLIYNNASICNQVMNRKFKKVSLKLLYDILGTDYNYFAITQEVWLEKRSEYANQYSVGTKYPTLSPITDPNLRIVVEDDDSDSESMIRRSKSLFGDNLNVK